MLKFILVVPRKTRISKEKFTQGAELKMAGARNGYIFPPPKSFMQGSRQQATRMGQSLQPPPNGPNFCTQTFLSSPMQNIHRIRFNDNLNTPPQFQNYGGCPSTPSWPHRFVNNNRFHNNFNGGPPFFTLPPKGGFEPPHRQPRARNHFMNGGQWRQKFNGIHNDKQNNRSDMRGCHVTSSSSNANRNPEIDNSSQVSESLSPLSVILILTFRPPPTPHQRANNGLQ